MEWNLLFGLANVVALAAWAVLLTGVLRKRNYAKIVRIFGVVLALLYVILLVSHAGEASILMRDYSLAGIRGFFNYQVLALAGWLHYLAFDLWVGTWEVDNAGGMSRPVLSVALVLTFALGPLGLCFFLAARRLGSLGPAAKPVDT